MGGKITKIIGNSAKLGISIALADFLAGCGLYNYALSRKPIIKWQLGDLMKKYPWVKDNCKDLYMTSRDGLTLHAYFRAKPTDKAKYIVMCHGYRADATLNGPVAEGFYRRGYGILAPDARGHGQSEGNYIGMGWPERKDIVDWVKLLNSVEENAEIVLYGISMGAATVMCASGESDLPANVRCIIEDCGFTSIYDEFLHELETFRVPKLLRKPLLASACLATKLFAGYDFSEGGAVTQLPKNKTPMLFIHGDRDKFVPYRMMDENYNACAAEKVKVSMPGTKHAASIIDHEDEYWKAIDEFVGKYVK